ncbi:MAG TPA: ABC transporter family substrate-binding protein [Pseudonocardia sp.]|nr:ABC transporter family substrate-binding protein [Pseudonocardia sp.]
MRARLVALLAVSAAVLTGCAGGPGGSGAGPDSDGRGRPAGGTDLDPHPRDALRDGGDLRLPLLALPNNFNYAQVDGTHIDVATLSGAVLPALFVGTADGGLRLNSDYLSAASVTSTAPQVVTYTLDPRATWTDGTPLTWRDLAAQWHAQGGSDPGYRTSATTGYDRIASVAMGADERQAVVTFSAPFAEWQGLFSPLLPASLTATPAAFNTAWRTGMPVTAGPFAVSRVDRVAQTVTLDRNSRWWGTPPKLDRMIFKAYDPAATPDALANGELDLYRIGPNADLLRRAEQTPGAAVRSAPSRLYTQLSFNGAAGAPLADLRLRRALAQSIDRALITRQVLGPVDPGARPSGNHIYVPGTPEYRDNSDALPYDPAAAERTLDEAGWTRTGATRAQNGRPLTVRLVYGAAPTYRDIAAAIAHQLARIGVTADLRQYPSNEIFPAVTSGNLDLALFSWYATASPLSGSTEIYGSPLGSPLDGKPDADARQNYGRVASPEIDAAFAEGNAELDAGRRAAIGNRIDRLISGEAHSVPLFAWPGAVAVRTELANFGASGFADPDYVDAGFLR